MPEYEITTRGERPDDFLVGLASAKGRALAYARKYAKKTGQTCHVWHRAKPWARRERLIEVKP